jgi:hypothetical protein
MVEKLVFKVIEKIAGDTDSIFKFVDNLKIRFPKLDNKKLSKKVANKIKKKCAIQGAIMAIPGAIPGIGTLIQIAISSFDFSFLIKRQVYLNFAIGHCYGISDVDDLKRGTFNCMGSSLEVYDKVIGKKIVDKLSDKAIKIIIKKLQKALTKKFLMNMTFKLIPFGIGIIIGAISHWKITSSFQSHSISYYSDFLKS